MRHPATVTLLSPPLYIFEVSTIKSLLVHLYLILKSPLLDLFKLSEAKLQCGMFRAI